MKYYLEHDDAELRKKIFSSIINSIGAFGLLITFTGVLFSKEISGLVLGSSKYSNLTALLFITLLIDTLGYFGLYLLKTQEKAKKIVYYSVAGAFVNLTLNIIFIYSLKIGVSGIFLAQIISSLFLLLILLKDILPEYKFTIDTGFIKTAIIFSFPIILGGFMSSAVDVCDRFFLNLYTDKNIVGIYSFSYKIAMVMNVFIISFRTAWMPHALNLSKSSNPAEVFGKIYMKLIAVGFLILLSVTLFAPVAFKIKLFGGYLFDQAYQPGLIILPYILLAYLFNGIASYYSLYPFTSNKSYHFLISDGSAFIMNIILNMILIPVIGMLGAAIATTAAFIVSAYYLYIISRKKVKIIYPLKEIVLITVITLIVFSAGMISRSVYLDIILIAVYVLLISRLSKINLTGLLKIT